MNERLLKAIRKLSKQRTPDNRKAMYMAVLRASFIVPTEETKNGQPSQTYCQDLPLQGRPVYVAFTSVDAMRNWRPEHGAYVTVKGMDLMEQLVAGPAASLLINPKNTVGGELYRNELKTLADAAPKLRAWLNQDTVGAAGQSAR